MLRPKRLSEGERDWSDALRRPGPKGGQLGINPTAREIERHLGYRGEARHVPRRKSAAIHQHGLVPELNVVDHAPRDDIRMPCGFRGCRLAERDDYTVGTPAMPDATTAAFESLCQHARESALLESVAELLGWDERTYCRPPPASTARSR